MKYLIVAADRIVDGQGDHSATMSVFNRAQKLNLPTRVLEIVDLARRWEDKLKPHEFKSGASAMAALERARKLLRSKKAAIVLIKGTDLLKTGYSRTEREKFMRLYNHKYTPLQGYTQLVNPFLKQHKISRQDFFDLRDGLFENYSRTWKQLDPKHTLPDARWFKPLTEYFRGVDCANPNIDYSGQLILTDEMHADLLKIPKKQRVPVLGNAFSKMNIDGMESIPAIAPYDHLKRTIRKALKEAQIDFKTEFINKRAWLEAYTCYPVVPIALLLQLGLAKNAQELLKLLKTHEVTITGGLNLARAPWNLTSLNYMIMMREKLITSKGSKYGLVHGNGSLGNQQGITILGHPGT